MLNLYKWTLYQYVLINGGTTLEYTFSDKIIEPYFYSCDGIITDVNKEFIDFTGFEIDELLGKSLTEIGHMLKINSQILLDNISSNYSGYIFTKSFSAREVNIYTFTYTETNGKVYTFIEKPNSRLDDKLVFIEQLFKDDTSGFAVYSAPDLILLKSNQKYLDLMILLLKLKEIVLVSVLEIL